MYNLFTPYLIKNCVTDWHIMILNLRASPLSTICSDTEFLQIDDETVLYSIICKRVGLLGYIEQHRVYNLQPDSFLGKSSSQV